MIIALCISAVVLVVLTAVYTYYFRLAFARKKPKFGSLSFAGSNDPEHKRKIEEGLKWFESQEKEHIFIRSFDGLNVPWIPFFL